MNNDREYTVSPEFQEKNTRQDKIINAVERGLFIRQASTSGTNRGATNDYFFQKTESFTINLGSVHGLSEVEFRAAQELINKREREAYLLELDKMQLKLQVLRVESRKSKQIFCEVQGLFNVACKNVQEKISGIRFEHPARGFEIVAQAIRSNGQNAGKLLENDLEPALVEGVVEAIRTNREEFLPQEGFSGEREINIEPLSIELTHIPGNVGVIPRDLKVEIPNIKERAKSYKEALELKRAKAPPPSPLMPPNLSQMRNQSMGLNKNAGTTQESTRPVPGKPKPPK